ncbi:sigma-70 family RNA polymerase sigma factor [Noviherbaspirillum sp. CPCC 100848]|uniref:Sigma-70 family RNA polymerase sigma factor n=1 Tax=Noviherbaspirillum album TaxID=3080276 RepID=A0ABU6JAS1_9BURK|nr:sigma-70 family RNA polymerase sigma factor [Noviherbaspirillum sp. CPCC 100848]MEC4720746.1 sigma-70 family RNA polymerase sigma factor [Noviherbaspirillum sp. CPCC 100848]
MTAPDNSMTLDADFAAGEGSDVLFRNLVAQYETRLYRFIVKHIGHGSDAEDLAQQTFVDAVRTYSSFKGESQLSTWLFGIAMNLVRNYLSRSPHRIYQFENIEDHAGLQSTQNTPEESLSQKQQLKRLDEELQALAPEMRETLLLVALEELSYEDAAIMLSIPTGTVRSRVSRARKILAERIAA